MMNPMKSSASVSSFPLYRRSRSWVELDDRAEWLLQVVAGDVREPLQLLVRPLQVVHVRPKHPLALPQPRGIEGAEDHIVVGASEVDRRRAEQDVADRSILHPPLRLDGPDPVGVDLRVLLPPDVRVRRARRGRASARPVRPASSRAKPVIRQSMSLAWVMVRCETIPMPTGAARKKPLQGLLPLPQDLFGPLLFCDVHVHAEDPDKPPRLVVDPTAEPHPPGRPLPGVVAELQLKRFAARAASRSGSTLSRSSGSTSVRQSSMLTILSGSRSGHVRRSRPRPDLTDTIPSCRFRHRPWRAAAVPREVRARPASPR